MRALMLEREDLIVDGHLQRTAEIFELEAELRGAFTKQDVEAGAAVDADRIFEAQFEIGLMRAQFMRQLLLEIGFAMEDRAALS